MGRIARQRGAAADRRDGPPAPAGRRWSSKADADSAGRPAERKRLRPFAQARDDAGLRKAGRRRQGWTAFGGFAQLYISLAER